MMTEMAVPTIGISLDHLLISYQIFLSSDKKTEKLQRLADIAHAATNIFRASKIVLESLSSKIIGPDPAINPIIAQAVKASVQKDLHMQILNLQQLAILFMDETRSKESPEQEMIRDKIQLLYQIHYLSKDIAENALVTNAEPDRGTERA